MPVSLTPTLLPKRNKTQQLFWTNTWPQLKEEGWNYDGKRFFYPPKRRQAGCAEAKEFFSGIGEITEYIRKNPVRFIDDHAKGGDASAEEHKSSGEDTKKKSSMKKKQKVVESDKDSDVTVSSEENDGEDGDTAFTPYSSPKPEPSAPTPKTSSFRLESALSSSSSANASSPFTKKQAKKESKKSIIKLRVVPLKERQSKKKSMSMDSGAKQYICDRCGRTDFINGHALGGHKKYCSKPEYREARERSEMKSNGMHLKRKRSVSAGSCSDSPRTACGGREMNFNESQFNLLGITSSIRDFADRVDDLDEAELDKALNTKDLFDLQVIQTVLREERARISGRLAGMASVSPDSFNSNTPRSMMIDDSSFDDFLVDQEAEEIREEQKAATPEEIEADINLEASMGSDMAVALGF